MKNRSFAVPKKPIKLVLDQNIPRILVAFVQKHRPTWEVHHVIEIGLEGRSDSEIYEWAQRNEAIVVSFDEDFADARTYPLGKHHGVVRLRVWPTSIREIEGALLRLWNSIPDQELSGSLIIIHNDKIRIRRKPMG